MKKVFLALFFAVYGLSAQTILLDEKIDDNNSPGYLQYLPQSQKIVFGATSKSKGNSAFTVDQNGKKIFLYENDQRIYCNFSRTEKSYKTSDSPDKGNYNFIFEGNQQLVSRDKMKEINFKYFGRYSTNNAYDASGMANDFSGSFNDLYIVGLSNGGKSWRIKNVEKDELYLELIEIKTNSNKRVKLEKPDFAILKGNEFAKSDFDVNFACRLNDNQGFDLITKSLSADGQKSVFYKNSYNFEGKKIKVQPFTVELHNKYLITSANGGGPKYFTSSQSMQSPRFTDESFGLDVLSINNYYEDPANGDVFVYGLFSDQAPKKIDGRASAKGFYVFKFDKDGNKLWESVNAVDSKDFFEKVAESSAFQVSLLPYNKDLIFSASVNSFTEFTNAAVIDKNSGSVLKSGFIEYNNNLSHGKLSGFISNTYDYKGLRNKVFSPISFAAISINSKVMDYLKNVPEKGNRLYYETLYSDQGIWLIETDNKKYYKVILFQG